MKPVYLYEIGIRPWEQTKSVGKRTAPPPAEPVWRSGSIRPQCLLCQPAQGDLPADSLLPGPSAGPRPNILSTTPGPCSFSAPYTCTSSAPASRRSFRCAAVWMPPTDSRAMRGPQRVRRRSIWVQAWVCAAGSCQ